MSFTFDYVQTPTTINLTREDSLVVVFERRDYGMDCVDDLLQSPIKRVGDVAPERGSFRPILTRSRGLH